MFIETETFESPYVHSVRFLFVGLNESAVCKRKVDTRDELLARFLDVADRIKERKV